MHLSGSLSVYYDLQGGPLNLCRISQAGLVDNARIDVYPSMNVNFRESRSLNELIAFDKSNRDRVGG